MSDNPVPISVVPAHRDMVRDMAATLGRAFFDDPVMTWLLPDPVARANGLRRMFATMTRHHYIRSANSEVARADVSGAAALWDSPGQWKQSGLTQLLMMPGFIRAVGSRIRVARQLEELMKRRHPEEPHWYLAVIGSDPAVRGQGFGQVLMRSGLSRADAQYAPAYLEATSLDNVGYYERFGFQVTDEVTLPGDGPPMWAMWRPAR